VGGDPADIDAGQRDAGDIRNTSRSGCRRGSETRRCGDSGSVRTILEFGSGHNRGNAGAAKGAKPKKNAKKNKDDANTSNPQ